MQHPISSLIFNSPLPRPLQVYLVSIFHQPDAEFLYLAGRDSVQAMLKSGSDTKIQVLPFKCPTDSTQIEQAQERLNEEFPDFAWTLSFEPVGDALSNLCVGALTTIKVERKTRDH